MSLSLPWLVSRIGIQVHIDHIVSSMEYDMKYRKEAKKITSQ